MKKNGVGKFQLAILALVALPLAAQPQPELACGGAVDQRLFDQLAVPEQESVPAPTPVTYLPECWMCTTSTPCETECGWDPGKGGPVTCGEYGICEGWP